MKFSDISQIFKLIVRNYYSRNMMLKTREKLFRKLLFYTWDHSEFYRSFYQANGIKRDHLSEILIQDLPFTNKKIIMDHLDRVFTKDDLLRKEIETWLGQNQNPTDTYLGKYMILHTSGSSGTPSIIAYDLPSWNFSSIAFGLRVSAFSLVKKIKAAFVGATHGHFAGVSYSKNHPKFIYDFKTMSILDSIDKIMDDLNAFQPEQLFGYSSMIARLAEEALLGRLRIQPKLIGTSGELISDLMAEQIQKTWGISPRNMYISSETLLIGFSPKQGDAFTVYDDLNYVELIDTDKENEAEVVITNLFNYTTPLIRYQMGDLVEKQSPKDLSHHKGPFSTIYKIVGRSYDLFPVTTNQGRPDKIHPIVLVEFFVPGLKEIQFISINQSLIKIKYSSDIDLTEVINTKFSEILKLKEANLRTRLQVERVPILQPDQNGKIPLIKIM